MKKYLFFLLVYTSTELAAQTPDDVLRYSWYPQNGTARNLAIGGAMASLGGDLTAAFVNPAGLAFYRTADAVITPGFILNNNKYSYRDTKSAYKKNAFGWGPTGVVLGAANKSGTKSGAIAIAITELANFNNSFKYQGLNNYSSFSEQFAEEFAKSGRSIDEVLNVNSEFPYGAAPALYTYLVDTVRVNGILQVRAAPENILDAGQALQQELFKKTTGGLYEAAIGFAVNNNPQWFFGGTLGMPLVYYNSNTSFKETDTSYNINNGFLSFEYNDEFTTSGAGANLKLGAIYRPKEYIRIGLALHTPSFMWLKDERTTSLNTIIETPSGNTAHYNVNSLTFTNNQPGRNKYVQMSPWKAMLSASYVFREIENVKRQRAFVTADIEYVSHSASRFYNDEEDNSATKSYYKRLNKVIKDQYKGTFNFKLGGELKYNTIMGRLGFAYYTNPYKDDTFKANRMLLSGGLGYRDKGVFLDLTYVHHIVKDVHFPYTLEDRANTYATSKQTVGQVVATVGWKLW